MGTSSGMVKRLTCLSTRSSIRTVCRESRTSSEGLVEFEPFAKQLAAGDVALRPRDWRCGCCRHCGCAHKDAGVPFLDRLHLWIFSSRQVQELLSDQWYKPGWDKIGESEVNWSVKDWEQWTNQEWEAWWSTRKEWSDEEWEQWYQERTRTIGGEAGGTTNPKSGPTRPGVATVQVMHHHRRPPEPALRVGKAHGMPRYQVGSDK
ncbi:unnamed protein product [Durusdinium trenchii]|uniref:Uncharacterized protein n=1 Tax=Durusdinium trenchii TaxID=1381693 RepID=A0ABP0KFL6_9DINO